MHIVNIMFSRGGGGIDLGQELLVDVRTLLERAWHEFGR